MNEKLPKLDDLYAAHGEMTTSEKIDLLEKTLNVRMSCHFFSIDGGRSDADKGIQDELVLHALEREYKEERGEITEEEDYIELC